MPWSFWEERNDIYGVIPWKEWSEEGGWGFVMGGENLQIREKNYNPITFTFQAFMMTRFTPVFLQVGGSELVIFVIPRVFSK